MKTELFIVGLYRGKQAPWEFVGVFDDRQKAEEACISSKMFVGPATLNEVTPKKTMGWPGCYYPKVIAEKPYISPRIKRKNK